MMKENIEKLSREVETMKKETNRNYDWIKKTELKI